MIALKTKIIPIPSAHTESHNNVKTLMTENKELTLVANKSTLAFVWRFVIEKADARPLASLNSEGRKHVLYLLQCFQFNVISNQSSTASTHLY